MRHNRKFTKGSKMSAAVNSANGPKGWTAENLTAAGGTLGDPGIPTACSSPAHHELLTADSQLRNFMAQDFPPFPQLMKETFYFSFSRTKLAKIPAGIPKEKTTVAAKSQLTRLKGSCNIRVPTRLVPGGSSGCSRSNAIQLRRKPCVSNSLCLTKPVLEPFVFPVMSSEEVFFSSLCRSTIG